MLEILKKIDLSKYSVNFTINGNQYISTWYGGILSLLLFILTVLAAVGFGLDMVKRRNPLLISSISFFEGYPELKREEYDFAFSILQIGNEPISDFNKSFYITLQHEFANSLTNVTKVNYLLEKCDRLKNDLSFTNELLAPIENYYCLPKDFKASIIASKNRPVHSGLCFEMYYCDNSTSNVECRPKPHDTTFYIHFMYKDNYVDSSDYENPIKTFWDGERIRTSSEFDNSNQYTFQKMEYISDNGILLKDNDKYNSFHLSRKESSYIYNPSSLRMFYTVINLSRFLTIHSRNYIKLQAIAADAGGIIQFFSVLLTVVAGKYSEISFYETYVNVIKSKDRKVNDCSLSEKNNNFENEVNLEISKFRKKDLLNEHKEPNDISVNKSNNKIIETDNNFNNSHNSNNLSEQERQNKNLNYLNLKISDNEVSIPKFEIEKIQIELVNKSASIIKLKQYEELEPPLEESMSNLFVYNFITAICCYKKENAVLNKIMDEYSDLMSLEKIYEVNRKIDNLEKLASLNDKEIMQKLKNLY